jgi:hypothetical protein
MQEVPAFEPAVFGVEELTFMLAEESTIAASGMVLAWGKAGPTTASGLIQRPRWTADFVAHRNQGGRYVVPLCQ